MFQAVKYLEKKKIKIILLDVKDGLTLNQKEQVKIIISIFFHISFLYFREQFQKKAETIHNIPPAEMKYHTISLQ